jgi:hypothetical protein
LQNLFVCNHIVFPSDAKHQPDGENPMTLKASQKNIKTKENKNQEQKDNTI